MRRDLRRSFPLVHFASVGRLPGVTLVSLQKGPGADQLPQVADLFSVLDLSNRLDVESGAFMDTAAIMKNLDLVITSDTATAHLAGGLGVPVWVALPRCPRLPMATGARGQPLVPDDAAFPPTGTVELGRSVSANRGRSEKVARRRTRRPATIATPL